MALTSPPTPKQVAALAKEQKEGQAAIIWTIGMFCIFGWDYFMNLPKEIKYIWRKKFTVISGLYVANRYFGLVQFPVIIWLLTPPIANSISFETCKHSFLWQPVGGIISTLLSQVIMGSRLYAMYGQSKLILGILGMIVAAEFAVQAYSLKVVFPAPSPAPGVVIPCSPNGPLTWLIVFWIFPLVYDTITFALTLFKSMQYWRSQVGSATLSLLFRDGLIYFAAIFSMNLINVVLFITQDDVLRVINLPSTIMLNVIMSCRLVLNLRKPRNLLPSSFNLDSPGEGPFWKAPGKRNESYELPASAPTSVAIVASS